MMVPRVSSACSQEDLYVSGDTAASQASLTGWPVPCITDKLCVLSGVGSSEKGIYKSLQLHIPHPQQHVSGHFNSWSLVLPFPVFQEATCSWVGFKKSQISSMTLIFSSPWETPSECRESTLPAKRFCSSSVLLLLHLLMPQQHRGPLLVWYFSSFEIGDKPFIAALGDLIGEGKVIGACLLAKSRRKIEQSPPPFQRERRRKDHFHPRRISLHSSV